MLKQQVNGVWARDELLVVGGVGVGLVMVVVVVLWWWCCGVVVGDGGSGG